jgi:hypothetical protein
MNGSKISRNMNIPRAKIKVKRDFYKICNNFATFLQHLSKEV